MISDTCVELPCWMHVGANVVQVRPDRYHGDIVSSGTVSRILARDIVVVGAGGSELVRFRRNDYNQRDDEYYRSSGYGTWHGITHRMYRADDPRAVTAIYRSKVRGGVKLLKKAIDSIDDPASPETPDALDAIAAHAAKLARFIRDGQ